MAKTKIDTLAWLKDLGFTEDEAKVLQPQFESRADKLSEMQMRQSDYDRQSNTLKSEYDTLNNKLNEDLAEFASMSAAEQSRNGDLRAKIEAAEERALKITQRLTRIAEENGLDPQKALEGIETVAAKKVEPVAFDDKALRSEIRDQIGGVAGYMLDLNAELPSIAFEYEQLTGKKFDTRAFVSGIKADIAAGKTGNLDPVKRFEAQFEIPKLRTEAAITQRKNEDAALRAEERSLVLSEQAIPGAVRPGEHAPVLRLGGESKLQRPQPSTRMSGAVAALATGKYRDKSAA